MIPTLWSQSESSRAITKYSSTPQAVLQDHTRSPHDATVKPLHSGCSIGSSWLRSDLLELQCSCSLFVLATCRKCFRAHGSRLGSMVLHKHAVIDGGAEHGDHEAAACFCCFGLAPVPLTEGTTSHALMCAVKGQWHCALPLTRTS